MMPWRTRVAEKPAHVNALLSKSGNLKEAIGAALMATDLSPNDQLAWTSLSQIYMKNGQIKEAEAAKSNATILGIGGKLK